LGSFDFIFTAQGANDSDGVLIIDSKLIVSGTYNQIWVKPTGYLIVETTLEAAQIVLEPGSVLEITGGKLVLVDSDTFGAKVFLNGTCKTFKMTKGASINIAGSYGPSQIGQSIGGDVELNLTVTDNFYIEDSTIRVLAGSGYTKPTAGAATNSNLSDYQYAGGNASLVYDLPTTCAKHFYNSTMILKGGSGGKASDGGCGSPGFFGKGGGYSNGGTVTGNVGRGGRAEFKIISATPLKFEKMNFTIIGGTGGKAGSGNTTVYEPGGGGGGYSGGDGGIRSMVQSEKFYGKPGGPVGGFVGAGGNASFEIHSDSLVDIINSSIFVLGGKGGDAGESTMITSFGPIGGMGGFGYSGGGGGTGSTSISDVVITRGGDGGNVTGSVGSGGNAELMLRIKGNLNCEDSTLNVSGGSGGKASTGTKGEVGGGGGGGYGGGGGGGGSYIDAGNVTSYGGKGGNISGNVGTGGNSQLYLDTGKALTILHTELTACGGPGGNSGAGGIVSNTDGGSGGGGFGGGGGGGKSGSYIGGYGGDGGILSGNVGSGGSSDLLFVANSTFEVIDSMLYGYGGSGGSPGSVGKYYSGKGGGGGGGFGGSGGGGASASSKGGVGGKGSIASGNIAAGGDTKFNFIASKHTISKSSVFLGFGGPGGSCAARTGETGGTPVNGYGQGGDGTGQSGKSGTSKLSIPMGIPRLLTPPDNIVFKNTLPAFEWIPQHNSTSFGSLSGHRLEIDDSPDFTIPVVIAFSKSGFYSLKNPLRDSKYFWRVRAEYGSNNAGWSEVRTFTIDTMPVFFDNMAPEAWTYELTPNCTVEIGDQDTSVAPESIQYAYSLTDPNPGSFGQWQDIEGVIDLSSDYSRVLAWARPQLKAGQSNFIKWRAMDIVGNEYNESEILSVRVDVDTPVVDAIAPLNGSWLHDISPVFVWQGLDTTSGLSGNCSFYLYEYDTDSIGRVVHEFNGTLSFNSTFVFEFETPVSLEFGEYCWQVKIGDEAGLWSGFSKLIRFHIDTVKPIISGISPSDQKWVTAAPDFSWEALDTYAGLEDSFVLELGQDENFQKLVYQLDLSDADIIVRENHRYEYHWQEEQLAEGTWFWRIKAAGNEGLWSDYSQPLQFRVDDTPPLVVPVLPLNGSWTAGHPTLSWNAWDTGSGPGGFYRIMIAEDREFLKIVVDEIIRLDPLEANLSYEVQYDLFKYVYYWSITAQDAVGLWSSPSTLQEIRVDLKEPGITPIGPDKNRWVGKSFDFSWTAEDTLSGLSGNYHLQVAEDDEFEMALLNISLSGPKENDVQNTYTTSGTLPEGQLYWRVRTKDNAGNWCKFSTPRGFFVDRTEVEFRAEQNRPWFNTVNVSFEIEINDLGAGVDTTHIYYRTSYGGIALYGPWQLVPEPTLEFYNFNEVECTVIVKCKEGFGNFVQFRARDLVNPSFQESPNYMIAMDRSSVIFSEPLPLSNLWQDNVRVICGISIYDFYSGVNISSLEYRFTGDGLDNFGEWQRYNYSCQRLSSGEFKCQLEIIFKPGEDNFVEWRVKDNAENGFFTSESYQVKVRKMTEGEHSEQSDPSIDRHETDDGWDWLVFGDGIFLLRLFSILIVLIVLIALLSRLTRKRNYTDTSSRKTSDVYPEEDDEDLEEVMAALDDELKGKKKTED
jgi:hypothetical protein